MRVDCLRAQNTQTHTTFGMFQLNSKHRASKETKVDPQKLFFFVRDVGFFSNQAVVLLAALSLGGFCCRGRGEGGGGSGLQGADKTS